MSALTGTLSENVGIKPSRTCFFSQLYFVINQLIYNEKLVLSQINTSYMSKNYLSVIKLKESGDKKEVVVRMSFHSVFFTTREKSVPQL